MRLRTRLRISSAISIGSILAIGSVLAWAVRDSRRASDAEDLATGLRQLILERGIMRDEFLLYRETRARVQWEAATARLESQLRSSTIVFEEVEPRRTIDEMLRLTESGKGLFEDLVRLPDERETPPGPPSVSTALRERIASRLLLLSYELEGHSSRLEALASKRSSSTQHRTMLLVFLLVGTCLAVFATNAVIATRLVEHRIARLQVGAERIAAGDFAHRIGFVGDDELAALGRSFDEMVEKLRSITVSRDALEAESADRRKAQEALSSSEERFRIAAETSNDVIYEWDLKERVDWFGDVDGLLGFGPGEFPRTLTGWSNFLHPEDRGSVMAAIQTHLEGRAPYIVEYRMIRKDGVVRWWSARGAIARAPEGTPVRWVGTITDITERKRAEGALRDSESRFRQLAESLPQLVWTCQPDGPCDYLNRQWIDFTGVPEAQQFGFGWLEQLHPDDRAPTVAAWEAAVASGANFRVEFRIRRHDGEYRWFDTQAARLLDSDGHTVKWFGSNTDITERRETEEALRTNEARLRSLFDGMLEGYAHCEMVFEQGEPADWVYLDVNPAFETLTGLKDIVGKRVTEVIPGIRITNSELFEIYGRVATTGEPTVFEDHIPALKHWFAVSAYSPAAGEFVAVFDDITERKNFEASLRESEDKFKYIFEHSVVAKSLTLPSGVVQTNRAFADMLGYSPEELREQTWKRLSHPDDAATSEEQVRALMAGERDSARFTKRYIHKNGSIVWGDVATSLRRDSAGQPLYFMTTVNDVTERKRAEEEIRSLAEMLEERVRERTRELEVANREMEAFSYSVSHDLRAPLRALDGFSRILLEDYDKKLDTEGKRLLGIVRTNTVQMGNLIDDLLSFSRIGRQEMVRSDVDMEGLAKTAFRELGPAGERVSFTVGLLPHTSGDPSLMRQVFLNLISNAVKFTGPKAVRSVEVGARAEAGRVVYWVKDNGVGFDMTYASKLFGVFQRLHSAAEFEGTGVGLALVQRIVHRHGGEVWGEGTVGEGATFSFSLPREGGP